MHLVEPLVQVGHLPGEQDRRVRHRRVAGVAVHLGQRRRRGGQAIEEPTDPVGCGVERRHHRGSRDLRPRRLADASVEQRSLGGEPVDLGRRGARIAVRSEVIPPQRVRPDDDHTLGRVLAHRAPPVADDGRPPEAERGGRRGGVRARCRRVGGQAQRQGDLPSGKRRQVDARLLPPMGARDGALEKKRGRGLPELGGLTEDRAHAKRHGAVLDGSDVEIQPRVGAEAEREPHDLGRARDEGLTVDLGEPLPAHARRDALQIIFAQHHADGFDDERRPGCVRRADHDVTQRACGPGQCRDDLDRAGVVSRMDTRRFAPRPRFRFLDLLFQVEPLGVAGKSQRDGGAGRDLELQHDRMNRVRAPRHLGPIQVDDGGVGGRPPHELPVDDAQVGHARARLPTREGQESSAAGLRCRDRRRDRRRGVERRQRQRGGNRRGV